MKIGLTELIVLLVVALVVLGPDKFPKYAGQLGRALREFRKFSSEATKEIRESIVEPLEEAQKPLKEAMEPITSLKDEVEGEMKGLQKSFDDLGKPVKKEAVPEQKSSETQTEASADEAETEASADEAETEAIPADETATVEE